MTEAETRARITTFADPTSEPALGSADIEVVLQMSRRIDKYGLYPTDTGWEDTYDHNYAIAQCWLLKATRLAPRYLFMAGGKMFSRNQYYEHCIHLYQKFIGKANLSALVIGDESLSRLESIPSNWNGPND